MAVRVYINNEERLVEATNIEQLASELSLPGRGVALAVNNAVVPRGQWGDTCMNESDRITIIKAAFGG